MDDDTHNSLAVPTQTNYIDDTSEDVHTHTHSHHTVSVVALALAAAVVVAVVVARNTHHHHIVVVVEEEEVDNSYNHISVVAMAEAHTAIALVEKNNIPHILAVLVVPAALAAAAVAEPAVAAPEVPMPEEDAEAEVPAEHHSHHYSIANHLLLQSYYSN